MSTFTKERIAELRELIAKTTDWTPENSDVYVRDGYIEVDSGAYLGNSLIQLQGRYEGHQEDWYFAASSRLLMSEALDEIERLQKLQAPEIVP